MFPKPARLLMKVESCVMAVLTQLSVEAQTAFVAESPGELLPVAVRREDIAA